MYEIGTIVYVKEDCVVGKYYNCNLFVSDMSLLKGMKLVVAEVVSIIRGSYLLSTHPDSIELIPHDVNPNWFEWGHDMLTVAPEVPANDMESITGAQLIFAYERTGTTPSLSYDRTENEVNPFEVLSLTFGGKRNRYGWMDKFWSSAYLDGFNQGISSYDDERESPVRTYKPEYYQGINDGRAAWKIVLWWEQCGREPAKEWLQCMQVNTPSRE